NVLYQSWAISPCAHAVPFVPLRRFLNGDIRRIHGDRASSQSAQSRSGISASVWPAHHPEAGRPVPQTAGRGLEQDALVWHGRRARRGGVREGAQARILACQRQTRAEVRQGREAARIARALSEAIL